MPLSSTMAGSVPSILWLSLKFYIRKSLLRTAWLWLGWREMEAIWALCAPQQLALASVHRTAIEYIQIIQDEHGLSCQARNAVCVATVPLRQTRRMQIPRVTYSEICTFVRIDTAILVSCINMYHLDRKHILRYIKLNMDTNKTNQQFCRHYYNILPMYVSHALCLHSS